MKNKISKHKCNFTKTKQIIFLFFHFTDINFDTLYFSKVNMFLVKVDDCILYIYKIDYLMKHLVSNIMIIKSLFIYMKHFNLKTNMLQLIYIQNVWRINFDVVIHKIHEMKENYKQDSTKRNRYEFYPYIAQQNIYIYIKNNNYYFIKITKAS